MFETINEKRILFLYFFWQVTSYRGDGEKMKAQHREMKLLCTWSKALNFTTIPLILLSQLCELSVGRKRPFEGVNRWMMYDVKTQSLEMYWLSNSPSWVSKWTTFFFKKLRDRFRK